MSNVCLFSERRRNKIGLRVAKAKDESNIRHMRHPEGNIWNYLLVVLPFHAFASVSHLSQRKVTEQQGRELADRLKVPYIETSAKDPPVNVDAAFHELVRIVKSFP
uniref:Guanylate kinase-like domain-containing protein n=1 Tax=Elaeophora elaphi TaxID=1147741 RepID=A0A0R3RQG6_9BILA